jgi:hypothetical protein
MSFEGLMESIHKDLKAEAAQRILASRAKASLYELWLEFLLSNEEITVEFAPFSTFTYMRDIQPTQEQLLDYFESNREEFAVPDRLKIEYVSKSTRAFTDEILANLTDEELRAEFDRQVEADNVPGKEVDATQIFISAEERGEDAALAIAQGLRTSLALGADFENLTRTHSEAAWSEGSADELLGSAGVSQIIAENDQRFDETYREKVFALEAGDISEPFIGAVDGQAGAFLVKVNSVVDAFEKSRERVSRQLANQKAQEAIDDQLDNWRDETENHTTLSSFAKSVGLEPAEPQWIDFEPAENNIGFLRGIGSLRNAAGFLGVLKDDGGVGALKIGSNLVALRVSEYKRGRG